jgi:hypothetical protein
MAGALISLLALTSFELEAGAWRRVFRRMRRSWGEAERGGFGCPAQPRVELCGERD